MMSRRKTITWIIVAAVIVMAVVAVLCMERLRRSGRLLTCRGNAKVLTMYVTMYVDTHGGGVHYPRSLEELLHAGLDEPAVFRCPSDDHPMVTDSGLEVSYESVFDLVDGPLEVEPGRSMLMIWDKKGNHRNGRTIVFSDTHGDFVSEEEFQELLAGLKRRLAEKQADNDE